MNFKKTLLDHKKMVVFIAALVMPGGFIALGLWKTYDLYQKKKESDKTVDEFIAQLKKDAEENPE